MKSDTDFDTALEALAPVPSTLGKAEMTVVLLAVGFAIGALVGFEMSRASVAQACESHGRLTAGDRVYLCSPGPRVTDIHAP
jgi:hypothetical protein